MAFFGGDTAKVVEDIPISRQGHKKALLIGINYIGTKHELKGCIADVHHMQDFLLSHRGYTNDPHHMLVMTEEARDAHLIPKMQNILAAFQWLVTGNNPGDSLFMHYSGHGGQVKIKSDQRDTLIPLDYETKGQIDSDLLHRCLVRTLPLGVKLTVILDCCHSGTMLELPYTYRPDDGGIMTPKDALEKVVVDMESVFKGGFSFESTPSKILADISSISHLFLHRPEVDSVGYKHEHFAELEADNGQEKDVFVISGCKDAQTSADTSVQGYGSTGALSYTVSQKLRESGGVTFEGLLKHIRGFMSTNRLSQTPQLSCGVEVDPSAPFEF
ncbi:peptidase C14, caspase domain-containing protein [Chytriomyces sp. MP71]|nr:peptidase C14, caspase domain-containing protein [Chytriomyces sp. MP71]